jgi:hypothetical protein
MVMIACAAVAACGSVQNNGTPDAPPADSSSGGDAMALPSPVAPLAPKVGTPLYQGGQTRFKTATGTCTGRVAASMAGTGFCYLAANDDVRCSGMIGGVNYGMSLGAIGQTGATQILVMFIDNGMCITKTDHTVLCMGSNTNAFGQGGTSTAFSRWTAHADVAAIGSGTWDQICGITTGGQVFCGGLGNPNFGNPPVNVGAAGQTSFWVDTSGTAHLSDTTVLRPGESRTDCQVKANGLACITAGTFGPTNGTVVMGTSVDTNPSAKAACWLTEDATVTCSYGPRFAAGKVLYLAADYYSDSLCAIYNDGSVWCIGSNTDGKLGTGNNAALTAETMVAPPGSAHVACDP